VSGKQSKKERKVQREAQREAFRKQERQRTVFTMIVIAVVVAIGGVLVWVSLDEEVSEDDLADLLEDLESPSPSPEESEADDADSQLPLEERPIACGGEEPTAAGEDKPTFDEPADVLEEGTDYRAVVETSCGTVVIDLDEEATPEAVNSFVFLAEQDFFDGQLIFRNATTIGALQTGAGDNSNTWQVGYNLEDELETAEEEGYEAGAVAMANSGPNTAGSQFFMVYNNEFHQGVVSGSLEPTYTRFGEVVEGLDVLEEIGAIEVDGETPSQRIYMESVTIETN
jgi:peptidyl-prolyl cis-trans isomerase B (cyclophilin B)